MSTISICRLLVVVACAALTTTAQNVAGNSNAHGFVTHSSGTFGLFAANDQSSGMELWRLDLLSSDVTMVADISPGPAGSHPRGITYFQSNYVFAATRDNDGTELWQTDGVTASLVSDIHPVGSSRPNHLTAVDNLLFFVADDGTHGEELWQYDGTATTLVMDIRAGAGSSSPRALFAFGSLLLFSADDGANGRLLWRTDGTTTAIVPNSVALLPVLEPHDMVELAGEVVFVASDGNSGAELWSTDGVDATLLVDIEPGPAGSAPAGLVGSFFRAFFTASKTGEGRELWMSDGTPGGTTMIDIRPGSIGSNPADIITNNLFDIWFVADDGVTGREVWQVGVNGAGLQRMTDIFPSTGGIGPRGLVRTGQTGQVAFTDNEYEQSLWVTSAAPGGATAISTFRSGPNSLTRNVSLFGSGPLFFAADDTFGIEPWSTDGSSTSMLLDVAPLGMGPQQPDLDIHTDPGGTVVTTCIDKGQALGIGVIAFATAPAPPITLPGLIVGSVLITAPLVTDLVLLDATGMGCTTVIIPAVVPSIELAAQGFTLTPNVFPLLATDLASFGISSQAFVTLFGGPTKSVGSFSDKDHRYEVTVNLPPLPGSGFHASGEFVFRHRLQDANNSALVDVEGHSYAYDGTSTHVNFDGATPLETIKGLELWFVDNDGNEAFVWKSYC